MNLEQKIFELMRTIAIVAHTGQYRHDGVTPYLVHPEQLADQFDTFIDKAIAIGHDVLEDGKSNGVDVEYIRNNFHAMCERLKEEYEGFNEFRYIAMVTRVMGGIQNLTHEVGTTYFDYIRAITCDNKKFKMMDIMINVTDNPTERQKEKYIKAMKILTNYL